MCFSGGGGSSAHNARNAQLSVQRRQVSTSSITGYNQGGWGNSKTGKELVAVTPAAVGRVLPQTAANMSDSQLTQQIQARQNSNFKTIRDSVNPAPANSGLGGAQSPSSNRIPDAVYAGTDGKVLSTAPKANAFTDGMTRKTYGANPNIVVKGGKSFYEYTTTTETYKSGGYTSSPNALNRTGNIDPSAALKATRRLRGAGLKITQGNSTVRANRGGGLRIDMSGVNSASTRSGVGFGTG